MSTHFYLRECLELLLFESVLSYNGKLKRKMNKTPSSAQTKIYGRQRDHPVPRPCLRGYRYKPDIHPDHPFYILKTQ